MNINNLYNFKNPVRHFLNINGVIFGNLIDNIDIKDLSWSEPINFRIRKNESKYRTLRMPNILNFKCSINMFKDYVNFENIDRIDSRKRLVPNLNTGDFATGTYDFQLENDFQKLCIYDNLLKLDIKAYYDRIYTHDIEFQVEGQENFLTNLNNGNTNGLLMGNYISLYFAEKYLKNISNRLQEKLNENSIDCQFSYFSDDFYMFCNTIDNKKIINIFDEVLEEFNLERSDDEIEIWDYPTYNEYNLIEKYWKKIISDCKYRYRESSETNKLFFTNQLIYRLSKLGDYKSKRIFINTFFKSNYFYTLDTSRYELEEYNFHQICYAFSFSPEILLYAIDKFSEFDKFKDIEFENFLTKKYEKILNTPFNDEQLYYYFAIKLLEFDDIIQSTKDKVIKSNNQILISYYLSEKLFDKDCINILKLKTDERYWFQNYHLILYTDLKDNLEFNINKYLLPQNAIKDRQKPKYIEFYKLNIKNEIPLINDINTVRDNISNYLYCKVQERNEVFGDDEE